MNFFFLLPALQKDFTGLLVSVVKVWMLGRALFVVVRKCGEAGGVEKDRSPLFTCGLGCSDARRQAGAPPESAKCEDTKWAVKDLVQVHGHVPCLTFVTEVLPTSRKLLLFPITNITLSVLDTICHVATISTEPHAQDQGCLLYTSPSPRDS